MRHLMLAALAAVTLSSVAPSAAGLFGRKSHGKACDECSPSCTQSCNPCDYRCKRTDESEPVEKDCALIETEAICIPPITSSPFDCFRKKKACGGCGLFGCKGGCRCDGGDCDVTPACLSGSCDAGCDGSACGRGRGGLFSCLRGNSCGKIRCVKRLGSDSYECGERCVTTWEAVAIDCCGHELPDAEDLEDADAAEESDEDSADETVPPSPDEDGDNESATEEAVEGAVEAEDDLEAIEDEIPAPPEEDLEDSPEPPTLESPGDKKRDAAPQLKPDADRLTRLYFGGRKR